MKIQGVFATRDNGLGYNAEPKGIDMSMLSSTFRFTAALLTAGLAISLLNACSRGQANNDQGLFASLMPPKPGDVARDAFNVYDPDQRRKSVNLLSTAPWGGEEPYLKTYRLLVDDPDPTVRAACLRALGKHGTPDDAKLVIPSLKDAADYVRVEAAVALQRLHHEAAIDPLVTATREDADPDVRANTANALGQYPAQKVFQVLVGALSDTNYGVVTASKNSLHTLTGHDFGDEGSKWLQWAEKNENIFADRKPYYYPQYVKPPTTLEKMAFWKRPKPIEPRQPTGLTPVHSPNSNSAEPASQP